jgi:hypothetical protein
MGKYQCMTWARDSLKLVKLFGQSLVLWVVTRKK